MIADNIILDPLVNLRSSECPSEGYIVYVLHPEYITGPGMVNIVTNATSVVNRTVVARPAMAISTMC